MNTQLVCDGTAGLAAAFHLAAEDPAGNKFTGSGTATIDNYAAAFIVSLGADGFQIVPKIVMTPGQATITVTVTFSANDGASGIALTGLTVSVDLVAPAPPAQQATRVVLTDGPTPVTGSGAQDPGSATVSFSLS